MFQQFQGGGVKSYKTKESHKNHEDETISRGFPLLSFLWNRYLNTNNEGKIPVLDVWQHKTGQKKIAGLNEALFASLTAGYMLASPKKMLLVRKGIVHTKEVLALSSIIAVEYDL